MNNQRSLFYISAKTTNNETVFFVHDSNYGEVIIGFTTEFGLAKIESETYMKREVTRIKKAVKFQFGSSRFSKEIFINLDSVKLHEVKIIHEET